ncbi:MAG: hypothetical protein K2N70_00365 [Helicobacter sp.]|nr:hypothetical protein [Helicobacter sp.]
MFRFAQHDKIPCVIASEQRERGNQRAKNPNTSSIQRRWIATLTLAITIRISSYSEAAFAAEESQNTRIHRHVKVLFCRI